ncbi:M14 family metallopeptidase [Portibacter marinus]|uniref:succinylglutamate desuccinylase/aspartoacylase domain-containing protein n=1 Tax=Portibacter marinus TaxID=2898660 RepID=UPI001F2C6042|nr:succinylglutamate desuccinylase/aspartoacylase family protein [Portibacter marinus]
MERKIGEYIGEDRGPLVICIGGIHGNEVAGITALERVLKMLRREPIRNPEFTYRGKFVAIRGNLQAIEEGKRFIDKDLNRNFLGARLNKLAFPEFAEDKEAIEIIQLVKKEITEYQPNKLLILDLHTTSSPGGIFTIVPEHNKSLKVALSMHAPIIRGMAKRVKGTTMQYFTSEKLGVPTKAIVFESGQHDDPNAVTLAVAAVIAALRSLGCVKDDDVESRHDLLLKTFSEDLPALARMVMKHSVKHGDGFRMNPGYANFQRVQKGEVVATDANGDIIIPEDGYILMPLYQSQGEDGFFLLKKIERNEVH